MKYIYIIHKNKGVRRSTSKLNRRGLLKNITENKTEGKLTGFHVLFLIVYSITTVRHYFNRNYIIADMSVVTRIQYHGKLEDHAKTISIIVLRIPWSFRVNLSEKESINTNHVTFTHSNKNNDLYYFLFSNKIRFS